MLVRDFRQHVRFRLRRQLHRLEGGKRYRFEEASNPNRQPKTHPTRTLPALMPSGRVGDLHRRPAGTHLQRLKYVLTQHPTSSRARWLTRRGQCRDVRWCHPADCVHHRAEADPQDPHASGRAARTTASLSRSRLAHRRRLTLRIMQVFTEEELLYPIRRRVSLL